MPTCRSLFLAVAPLAVAIQILGGCASAPPLVDPFLALDAGVDPVEITDVEGVARRLFLDGRVYVAGQPDRAALAELASRGVTAVVNLRTPGEMDDRESVPFDEAAAADSLGLAYVALPLGGADHPYRPSVLSGLAEVLEEHPGRVLLHCRSGGRASYVWAGYLVRHRGWTLDRALRRGRAIGIPAHPLEGLLDTELTLVER